MKAALLDERSELIEFAAKSYTTLHPQNGWVEITADTLWNTLLACLESLGRKQELQQVAGIGIACMCPGLVALNEKNQPITAPILYSDRRSMAESDWIEQTVGAEKLFETTANTVMAGAISGTSMLWIKNHRPEIYQKTKYFGHINTMLCAMLTGDRSGMNEDVQESFRLCGVSHLLAVSG